MSSELYRRSERVLFSSIGDDIVALHVENGQCYGMESVTVAVWNLLAEPTDIPTICSRLHEIYDVEPDICRADVERLVSQFRTEGLVETVGGR
jgi:hypothetical protein